MVNLEMIFQQLHDGVTSNNPRYVVVDNEHVMDNDIGVKYHIYSEYSNKPYAISKGDEILLTGVQMTESEAGILRQLSKVIGKHYADSQRNNFYHLMYGVPAQAPSTEVPLSRRL